MSNHAAVRGSSRSMPPVCLFLVHAGAVLFFAHGGLHDLEVRRIHLFHVFAVPRRLLSELSPLAYPFRCSLDPLVLPRNLILHSVVLHLHRLHLSTLLLGTCSALGHGIIQSDFKANAYSLQHSCTGSSRYLGT